MVMSNLLLMTLPWGGVIKFLRCLPTSSIPYSVSFSYDKIPSSYLPDLDICRLLIGKLRQHTI